MKAKVNDLKPFDLVRPYLIENRVKIGIGLICLMIVDILQTAIPRIIKWSIDDLTTLSIDSQGLLKYGAYLVSIAFLMLIFRYLWRHLLIGWSRNVEEGLRNRLFSHIQTLSAGYYDKTRTGDLMAHATNDVNHVRMATGMGIVALTDAVFLGSASIALMLYINVRLTILVMIPTPFIIFGTRFLGKHMHARYKTVQAAFSDLTENAREHFAGIRIIQAFGREEYAISDFEKNSQAYIRKRMRLVAITGSFFPMMLFFSNIGLAIVLYAGGRQTIFMKITPGDFVAFISYLGLLTWPMMALGWVTNLIQRGKASLERIAFILNTRPEIKNIPDAKPISGFYDSIILKNVSFSYESGTDSSVSAPVLSEIDLEIKSGMTLGIVGPPGSGKTSLIGLIPRLYDVSSGRIIIDGTDIGKLALSDLRALISFVPQEPFLFAGTIRENIVLQSPVEDNADNADNADGNQPLKSKLEFETDLKLVKALKDADLHDTIEKFPNGLDTAVGEKGVILSGGQKQRIAIARAFYSNSAILVLDDPVSQVDIKTGNRIISAIRSYAEKRTVIIVSHRLSALSFADQIITLDKGRITESGEHIELMKTGGYYSKIFDMQEIQEAFHAY
ncbi:ABC transporter ATP-binding protein [Desulfobacterales bacterium HSG16]|nr:ABC transporter ATP-binding protein [Desulfobacterales bacterium HSG16]